MVFPMIFQFPMVFLWVFLWKITTVAVVSQRLAEATLRRHGGEEEDLNFRVGVPVRH